MGIQDYARLLRARWATVIVTALATVACAVAVSLLTTPLYEATTRLFVSTQAGSSLSETYQGNRFSQERVKSYAELLTGETLAQRTVDKLGLDMSASQLQTKVTATAKIDTVLINVRILDESPVRARDIANTLSDEFVTMARELEAPEDGSSPDVRVVVEQRASISDRAVTPNTVRNIGVGLILGIALGVGVAVLRDLFDNTVKSREEVEELTGAGMVGTMPLDKERRTHPAIEFEADHSAIAESFRRLRTNLQFLSVDNPPREIVITSSIPNEGKSTTAINLALALAEAGHSVVLVDGDMRRPSLAKYLGMVGSVGFSTVLSGRASLAEALQLTRYRGLSLLASGTTPPNPSELLASQVAKNLLLELRSQFDFVVIDSSPLLAVTDAAILSAACDGVLVVARFGQTKREQLAQSILSLQSVGAHVLGAIFAMVPVRGNNVYGYGYTYYGADYGDSSGANSRHAKRIGPLAAKSRRVKAAIATPDDD